MRIITVVILSLYEGNKIQLGMLLLIDYALQLYQELNMLSLVGGGAKRGVVCRAQKERHPWGVKSNRQQGG